jgi:hypothetical protein
MKKVLIACFFAIIMLVVPFTAVGQTSNISTVKNVDNLGVEIPEFYLTKEQLKKIDDFIDDNFEGEDKALAESIRDYIITPDGKVDIAKLADALVEYAYQPIPQEELDLVQTKEQLEKLIELFWVLDAFGSLVFLITSFVANRLGWLYTLINDGYDLFNKGIQLTIRILDESIDLVISFVEAVNLMLTIPQVFSDMMEKLFNQQFNEFLNIVGNFINNFVNDFIVLVADLIVIFAFIPEVFNYLKYQLAPFFEWILGAHWKDKIRIQGIVLKNFIPVSGAMITCRGTTDTTDSRGIFDFDVVVDPSEDSFPPNEYYGAHNCQITVEKDGEVLRQTSSILSYVFSSGAIIWPFIIIKVRSKVADFTNVFMAKFNNFLEWIHMFIHNIFRQISRIDILSI